MALFQIIQITIHIIVSKQSLTTSAVNLQLMPAQPTYRKQTTPRLLKSRH